MSTEVVEVNPFAVGGESSVVVREVGAVAASAREEAAIQAASVLAKKFPRDEAAAYVRVMKSCERPAMAEAARYKFPRGGKEVTGPSVDIAREIARCWGNVRWGLLIVSQDIDYCHIRGYALDLESNAYIELEDKFLKSVQRKNFKTGVTEWVTPDERDLRELINRRGAILIRNALLQLLPPDLVDAAMERCVDTLRKAARNELKQSRSDSVRRLALAFDDIGVSTEMIERRLGHKLDTITEDEIVDLRAIYKSVADNNSKRGEYFSEGNAEPVTAKAKDLGARIKGAAKKPAEVKSDDEMLAELNRLDFGEGE